MSRIVDYLILGGVGVLSYYYIRCGYCNGSYVPEIVIPCLIGNILGDVTKTITCAYYKDGNFFPCDDHGKDDPNNNL